MWRRAAIPALAALLSLAAPAIAARPDPPAPAPAAAAALLPGRPRGAPAALAPGPSPPHTLGWTNMGVLLNATLPEHGVQDLAVVGGAPVVALGSLQGWPEVFSRLGNGSWARIGKDWALDDTGVTSRLAAGGNGSLFASFTGTGADVSWPGAQGDAPSGWVRRESPDVNSGNWTHVGKSFDARGRGAALVRPRRPGEPILIAADGDRVAAAYADKTDTYVQRWDGTAWASPAALDWSAAGGTRDRARLAALAADGATTYALVATDELDGGVAAYVLKLDANGTWSRVGAGPAARSGAWRWAALKLDGAKAPVVALGGPPRAPTPTPQKSASVAAAAAAAEAPPPGAPQPAAASVARFDAATNAWAPLPPLLGPPSTGGALATSGDSIMVATAGPGGKPSVARSVGGGKWGTIRRADPLPAVADASTLRLAVLPGGGPVLAYQAARARGSAPLVAGCARCGTPAAAPAAAPGAAPGAAVKGAAAPALVSASSAGAGG